MTKPDRRCASGTVVVRRLAKAKIAGSIPVSRSNKKMAAKRLPFFYSITRRMDLTRPAGENHLRAALRSQMILGVNHAVFA